jgi:PAS domain-containing protein
MAAAPFDDELFRDAFEGALDPLLLVDADGQCLAANDPAEALFDAIDGLEGRLMGSFLSEAAFDASWETLLDTGRASGHWDVRLDEERRTCEFAAIAGLTPGVHLLALREAASDESSSDLLQYAEALAGVFETSPYGVLVFDGETVVAQNRHAGRVFDLDEEALTEAYADWELLDTDGNTMPADARPDRVAAETGSSVFDSTYGIAHDGHTQWLSVDALPVSEEGEVTRVITVFEDVTDSRERDRLSAMQNDRLEEYSATVSHDLRSPMSVAIGWIDIAIADDSTDDLDKAKRSRTDGYPHHRPPCPRPARPDRPASRVA